MTTPGPWFVEAVGTTDYENPHYICEVTNGHQRIAEYVLERDAHVIAAAPVLLASLREIVSALERGEQYTRDFDAGPMRQARNALNLAEGKHD